MENDQKSLSDQALSENGQFSAGAVPARAHQAEDNTENQAVMPQWTDYLLQYFGHFPAGQSIALCADESQSAQKLKAGQLIQRVMQAAQNGDSCIAVQPEEAASLQGLALSAAQAQQRVSPFVYDEHYLYLYRYWALEQALAKETARLKNLPEQAKLIAPTDTLLSDPHQIQALQMVFRHHFSIITGGPGTGKTYTLARIIAALNEARPQMRIALAAPTGKAAQRMEEALLSALKDSALQAYSIVQKSLKPVTLHRLLGLGSRHVPRFHAKQRLPYDVIVIDEASMLDLSLAHMLFAAVPDHAKLILLGDAEQLASVDVGAVLANLQEVPALAPNRTHLQTSRRFKPGAAIGECARFIQQQPEQQPQTALRHFEQQVARADTLKRVHLSPDMTDVVQLQYLPDSAEKSYNWNSCYDQLMYGFEPYAQALKQPFEAQDFESWMLQLIQRFDDYRILAAVRHGALGLHELNVQIELRMLQALGVLKQGDWYVGRPVMMTYNDYQLGLSNGDIGICLMRPSAVLQFEVYFPSLDKWVAAARLPKSMETAYALTIHKSQGSEFSHTAVVLDSQASQMMSKELIYTAITRAKKAVSLLAGKEALAAALTKRTARVSGLLEKINNQIIL